jgi:hypothetical protein
MADRLATESLRDLDLEHALLTGSGLFDEQAYLAQAGREASEDPVGHYLAVGWRLGLEPNTYFPGRQLLPYFSSLGIHEPPLITWLVLQSGGGSIPATWEQIEFLAGEVRKTGLFDQTFYANQLSGPAAALNPAIHYVTVGERVGIMPCPEFDPAYYAKRYQDVVQAGSNCLIHYVNYGRGEGRRARAQYYGRPGLRTPDPDKDNVILVVHEASRSGAPILGWNIARQLALTHNLYTVLMVGGVLAPDFEAMSVAICGPFKGRYRSELDAEDVASSLRTLVDSRAFSYAIVNSAESMLALEPLVRRFIPTLLLMHEFASYVHPASSMNGAFYWTTEVIFPASIVERAAEELHPILRSRLTHIMPQGVSLLPPADGPASKRPMEQVSNLALQKLTRKRETDGTFVVLSAGGVQLRKGTDLFLSVAATVVRRQPGRSIHFLWVGGGFDPVNDMNYSVYLKEQLNRSGLAAHVTFLDAVADLEPVYRIADVFLLPSRLDPLPNVGIDAAARGIPIICFRDASG